MILAYLKFDSLKSSTKVIRFVILILKLIVAMELYIASIENNL